MAVNKIGYLIYRILKGGQDEEEGGDIILRSSITHAQGCKSPANTKYIHRRCEICKEEVNYL
jgi:hypothetical protein